MESEGSFCAEPSLPASALQLTVKGAGPVKLPLAASQVRSLIELAQPARFGWRDKTLLDKTVRHTWEIPAGQLKIGDSRWKEVLQSLLDDLAIDLGLQSRGRRGSALKAHLHNLLIYGPGQFFRAHQDSETSPDMVATLVVVLPSAHEGGALLVEHRGRTMRFQGAPTGKELKAIAFYSDCRHELKAVRKGYRVALTYNLTFSGNLADSSPAAQEKDLTTLLGQYFRRKRWTFQRFTAPRVQVTPDKWVYLLDHEYTQKGLSWEHLMNGDRLRAKLLAAVAQVLDLANCFALADVKETWDAEAEEDDRYAGRYRGGSGEDDEEDEGDEAAGSTSEDGYELRSLIDSEVELRHGIDPEGRRIRGLDEDVADRELCWTTDSKEFDPFKSEYKGFMGNYGNTVDRFYHRAAIVLMARKPAKLKKTAARKKVNHRPR